MMVGKHGIQTIEVVVVVLLLSLLSFEVFVPTSAHPLLFLDKHFVQIYLDVNQFNWSIIRWTNMAIKFNEYLVNQY